MSAADIGRLAAIAAAQHGVIHLDQLRRTVPSEWARRRIVADGWLEAVAPRVYALSGSPATTRRSLMAGLLSLGPRAVVSHRAAAALHRFERSHDDAVEFTVPVAARGVRSPFTVHTTKSFGRADIVTVDGFKVTSATRTIVDLAHAGASDDELEGAIDTAVRLGASSPIVLARRLSELRGPGRWGCRRLDRLLVDSGGHTKLERHFLHLVRRSGLPRPRTQVVHRRGARTVARVDFLFGDDLVVEVSGSHGHSSPAERRRDAQRRNELQEIGRTVYEFTWHDITERPGYVAGTIRQFLLAAGSPAVSTLGSANP